MHFSLFIFKRGKKSASRIKPSAKDFPRLQIAGLQLQCGYQGRDGSERGGGSDGGKVKGGGFVRSRQLTRIELSRCTPGPRSRPDMQAQIVSSGRYLRLTSEQPTSLLRAFAFSLSARAIARKRAVERTRDDGGEGESNVQPSCSSWRCYTETLLRDVCCENTCLPRQRGRTEDPGGKGRRTGHREYYITAILRYSASQFVSSFPPSARQCFRILLSHAYLLFVRASRHLVRRLTSRERAPDSSLIAPRTTTKVL